MVRWAPKVPSMAAPRMCAELCQKTVLASGSSNLRSVSEQLPMRGLMHRDAVV